MLFIMKAMMVQKALHVATARTILFINMLKVTDGDKLHNDMFVNVGLMAFNNFCRDRKMNAWKLSFTLSLSSFLLVGMKVSDVMKRRIFRRASLVYS